MSDALVVWLKSTWISQLMTSSPVVWPVCEALHFVGLALLIGEPQGVVDLVERLRTIAGKTLRFRLPEKAPLADDMHDRLMAAGYRSPDFRLHILGRPIDETHPIPEVDPKRVVLADKPQASLQPPSF